MKEKEIREITQNAMKGVFDRLQEPIADVIASVMIKTYEMAWDDCMRFFNIDKDNFMNRQCEVENKNGKPKTYI